MSKATILLTLLAAPLCTVGQETLHGAIELGDVAALNSLIESGAYIEVRDDEGFTPLLEAAFYRDAGMVDALLHAGANVNSRVTGSGWAPLHAVARGLASTGDRGGITDTLTALVNAGTNVDARDAAGLSPLHAAVQNSRNAELVLALLSAGAEIDARDNNGWTPLFYASAVGKVDAIRALLAAGADVTVKATGAEAALTPLHHAASNGHELAVIALLDAGADVNARSELGNSSLHRAAARGHEGIVGALLHAGADRAVMDVQGRTPFDVARGLEGTEVLRQLGESGSD